MKDEVSRDKRLCVHYILSVQPKKQHKRERNASHWLVLDVQRRFCIIFYIMKKKSTKFFHKNL